MSFYIPHSHPDGISINVRYLDRSQIKSMNITQFDGQHWEESIEKFKMSDKE